MHAFNIIELEQRSQEWHDFRDGRVGASQAASIQNMPPFETRLELWERIKYRKKKETSPAMQRGIDDEPIALELINRGERKNPFKPCVLQSREHPNIIASLDGMRFVDGRIEILEIKSVRGERGLEEIPPYHLPQLNQQIFVSGARTAIYAEFNGVDVRLCETKRDEALIEKIVKDDLDFLQSLIDHVPPKPTERDWVTRLDAKGSQNAYEYLFLHQQIKAAELQLESLKKEMIDDCEHPRTILRSEFGELRVQKIPRIGAVDYDAIPELKFVNRDLYRKPPTEYWRFDRG